MGGGRPFDPAAETTIHATTIAHDGRALVLKGRAGAGKSTLAMACIGLGAGLVSDDRTVLRRTGNEVRASAPPALLGLIEIRGLGILRLQPMQNVPVAGVVDLDVSEDARLPPARTTALLGVPVTLYRRIEGAHVAAALLCCLGGGRAEPATNDDRTE